MKFISFILFISFCSFSCKKEYTCYCVGKLNGIRVSAEQTTVKMKKKDAESWCAAGNTSNAYVTITTETVCGLD